MNKDTPVFEVVKVTETNVTTKREGDYSGFVASYPRPYFPADVAVGEKLVLTKVHRRGQHHIYQFTRKAT